MSVMKWLSVVGFVSALTAVHLIERARFSRERDAGQEVFESNQRLSEAQLTELLKTSHNLANDEAFRIVILPKTAGSDATYELQMGPAGLPRYLHELGPGLSAFDDFTGGPARSCDGTPLTGELVVEYATLREERGLNPIDVVTRVDPLDGWVNDGAGGKIKVSAHVRDSRDLLMEVFETYRQERPLTVGERADIDGHAARPLITHHALRPGDSSSTPLPSDLQDSLWLDVNSLRPVRWEIRRASLPVNQGYVFVYTPGVRLSPPRLPKELLVPTCVERPR